MNFHKAAGGVATRKRTAERAAKVKTGCTTCGKVKCDEDKPSCQRCITTGRSCDGYASPFRLVASQPRPQPGRSIARAGSGMPRADGLRAAPVPTGIITAQDIDLLNRCFSTKTLFDVQLGCDDEARQILQASLTDPLIRHAVSSLRALRANLDASGHGDDDGDDDGGGDDTAVSVVPRVAPNPVRDYGLQQYCMALGGLASNLASPSADTLRSALLCCQVFISIEQVRGNISIKAQHIIQGLGILHEHRARPRFITAANRVVPAHPVPLPLLDVFVIKLIAAPCKFAEHPEADDAQQGPTAAAAELRVRTPSPSSTGNSRRLRSIAPDVRTEVIKISTATLDFLDKVARVASTSDALGLLPEKASLLDALDAWRRNELEAVYANGRTSAGFREPIGVSFMRLFHDVLKIVLLATLDSPDHFCELQAEIDDLKGVSSMVEKRVKVYNRARGKATQ